MGEGQASLFFHYRLINQLCMFLYTIFNDKKKKEKGLKQWCRSCLRTTLSWCVHTATKTPPPSRFRTPPLLGKMGTLLYVPHAEPWAVTEGHRHRPLLGTYSLPCRPLKAPSSPKHSMILWLSICPLCQKVCSKGPVSLLHGTVLRTSG